MIWNPHTKDWRDEDTGEVVLTQEQASAELTPLLPDPVYEVGTVVDGVRRIQLTKVGPAIREPHNTGVTVCNCKPWIRSVVCLAENCPARGV